MNISEVAHHHSPSPPCHYPLTLAGGNHGPHVTCNIRRSLTLFALSMT